MTSSALKAIWQRRPRYRTFSEMPSPLLSFFALTAVCVGTFVGDILMQTVPEFFDIGRKHALDLQGAVLSFPLIVLAAISGVLTVFLAHCCDVFKQRWFEGRHST